MGDAPAQAAPGSTSPRLTRRAAAWRVVLVAALYFVISSAYALVGGPLAGAITGASNVLLFRPGFGVEARFDTQAGAGGAEVLASTEHEPSGLIASNRLDLRFRLWVPIALFAALTLVTPARAAKRARALAIGIVTLLLMGVVLAWLTALYPAISTPENVLQLGTAPRVAFNIAYTALVLSNPTAALIPVLIWGGLMRREVGEILTGVAAPREAGPAGDKRR